MSLVKMPVEFSENTIWQQDVHSKAQILSKLVHPVYLVFVNDNRHTYLYFPHIIPDFDGVYGELITSLSALPKTDITPLLCEPLVDMSTTSIIEFFGENCTIHNYNKPLEQIQLLDVMYDKFGSLDSQSNGNQISDLISSPDLLEQLDDDYQRYLCMFLYNTEHDPISFKLRSFVKHVFVINGVESLYNNIFPQDDDILPCAHTDIEITSELMRCNIQMYMECKSQTCNALVRTLLANTELRNHQIEFAVCNIAFKMLSDTVVVCTGAIWYFDRCVWVQNSSNSYLWKYLTFEVMEFIGMNRVSDYIESVAARERILKDLKLRLQDDSFETKLDSLKHIISMHNGVFDTHTCTLSAPVASDYVSVRSGVKYEVFDKSAAQMQQLMHILESIFPYGDILDFFINSCATFLEGYNMNKLFYIWWGTGNNAKSLIQALVMKTFGEYCSTAPTSLITGKRTNSANATPELCHVEKKLIVFLQEPNPDEKIRAGMLKEMTGNDMMYIRQIFKAGKTAPFKAKLVLVCNNIIDIPGMDAALRRRIVVIPFTRTFLSEREYAARSLKGTLDPDACIIDPLVENELLQCCPAFMYLLCKRFSEIKSEPLVIPKSIQDTTEEYLTKNNYPLMFVKLFVRFVDGSNSAITEMYELFKDWFSRSYPGRRPANLEMFKSELENEGYVENNGSIRGAFVAYSSPL